MQSNSNSVIVSEHLGKAYVIGHNQVRRERYTALRDVLTAKARSVFGAAKRLAQGHITIRADESSEEFWALQNVSFEINRGDVVGVVGRNGAGKSTLLKILSRITEPTQGRVRIRGRVASLLEVGTGFHPELTGRENVFLNGAVLGMTRSEIKKKFDEIVAFAEVERFLDTPVKRYSSGMYVRLAFAVAAHLEPEILIVDEVLAVGDAEFQRKCLGKIGQVAESGRTILFVSHNMQAVTRLCTKGILLEKGQVVAQGPAAEIVDRYVQDSAAKNVSRDFENDERYKHAVVQLVSVGIFRPDGSPCPSMVEIGDELHIKIRYRTRKPEFGFRVAVNLFTQGVCAFTTMERTEQVRNEAGEYCSTVVVPSHLLTEGEYNMNLSMFTFRGVKEHIISNQFILNFQVTDLLDGNSARGDYSSAWAGIVRPMLNWNLSYLGESPSK
jgi:lipopolysaccharide transport system ATP-binding protein